MSIQLLATLEPSGLRCRRERWLAKILHTCDRPDSRGEFIRNRFKCFLSKFERSYPNIERGGTNQGAKAFIPFQMLAWQPASGDGHRAVVVSQSHEVPL